MPTTGNGDAKETGMEQITDEQRVKAHSQGGPKRSDFFCCKTPARAGDIECVLVKGHKDSCYMGIPAAHPMPSSTPQPTPPQASAGIPKLSDQFLLENVDAESCNVGPSESYLQAGAGAETEPTASHYWQYLEGDDCICGNCGVYKTSATELTPCGAYALAQPVPGAEVDGRDAEIARLNELQYMLRRRIHLVENHNQYFERCESLYCNPQGTSTYPAGSAEEIAQIMQVCGDQAKLSRITDLEAQLATAREALPSKEDIAFLKSMAFQGPDMLDSQERRVKRIVDGCNFTRVALTPATDKEAQG